LNQSFGFWLGGEHYAWDKNVNSFIKRLEVLNVMHPSNKLVVAVPTKKKLFLKAPQ
jgi:hypothetical protein